MNSPQNNGTVTSCTHVGDIYSVKVRFPGQDKDTAFQCDATMYADFQHALANNLLVDVTFNTLTFWVSGVTEHQ